MSEGNNYNSQIATASISAYNDIIQEIAEYSEDGNTSVMPHLICGKLFINNSNEDLKNLTSLINEKYTSGWILYSDDLQIFPEKDEHQNVPKLDEHRRGVPLEAEFSNGIDSIRIKLLHDSTYLVTSYNQMTDTDGNEYAFYDQLVKIRRKLREQVPSNAKYRFWYCHSDGRWEPYAQQFIEFTEGE